MVDANNPLNIGIVVFPDVEELDFVGPWQVFTTAGSKFRASLSTDWHRCFAAAALPTLLVSTVPVASVSGPLEVGRTSAEPFAAFPTFCSDHRDGNWEAAAGGESWLGVSKRGSRS